MVATLGGPCTLTDRINNMMSILSSDGPILPSAGGGVRGFREDLRVGMGVYIRLCLTETL